jgi:hypothetical protein
MARAPGDRYPGGGQATVGTRNARKGACAGAAYNVLTAGQGMTLARPRRPECGNRRRRLREEEGCP